MKKMLKKDVVCVYHYIDGKRIDSCPSYLRGDVSGLSRYVTGLSGDTTDMRGNVSGLSRYATGLSGDVEECWISEDERKNGMDISMLVGDKKS